MKAIYMRGSDEYETPKELFDDLDKEFRFNLDPCCTDVNRKCEFHYTKEQDGLTKDWGGTECSAIHHTVRSGSGWRSVTERAAKTIQ